MMVSEPQEDHAEKRIEYHDSVHRMHDPVIDAQEKNNSVGDHENLGQIDTQLLTLPLVEMSTLFEYRKKFTDWVGLNKAT